MRAIFTGDFQTDFSNIDKCKIVWSFILEQCKKKSLEAIVLTGDLKNQYNPVDLRVIKFWDKAISKAKELDIRVIILLGNHDRIGLYSDNKNWLSILKRSGAEVFDRPGVCELHQGKLAMLPFTTSKKKLKQRASILAKMKWNKGTDILLFHADIENCKYNQLGTKSKAKLNDKDLQATKYAWCIGGHIHLPQLIKPNIYYAGSPFIQDWGEVNQAKTLIIVTPDSIGDSQLEFVPSPISGWYDKDWPKYYPPKNWKDCHLRISIKVDHHENYSKVIDRAKEVAQREHPGAIIKIVPKFEEKEKQTTKIDIDSTDEIKIQQYVKETIPENLESEREKIISFLVSKLKSVTGLRRINQTKIDFESVKGENVLSFKKVSCNFKHQGITLIEGLNKDWDKQSNGTGKTNYTNLIPVILYGTTFKGQKFDRWARRHAKSRSLGTLVLRSNKKKIKIIRGRKPNKIQLLVNGNDVSSGLNRSSEDGTQAHIEHFTGFTWQTLANAVYIDKTIANAFLTGRKSDRVDLLYRFQNLERFTKAIKFVKIYESKHHQALEQNEKAIDILRTKIQELKNYLSQAKREKKLDTSKLKAEYKIYKQGYESLRKVQKQLESKVRKVQYKYEKKCNVVAKEVVSCENAIAKLSGPLWKAEQKIEQYKASLSQGNCPTCGAKVNTKGYKQKLAEAIELVKDTKEIIDSFKDKKQKANTRYALYEGTIDKAKVDLSEVRSKADREKDKLVWVKQKLSDQKHNQDSALKDKERSLSQLKREYKEYKAYVEALESKSFLKYCEDAFNKDGIPAFLNAQLAPVLNKACDHYSELFCDREIMIRFEVDNGDLVPMVINAHGGENMGDQSVGESVMAGIIMNFALKEIAPKTNVLILDEPAEGLSPSNIKKFARGLQSMKDKWETIFVVSHNPILLGELSNERTINIVKENRVSRVL